jgi:hypothetical protein
VSGVLSYVSGIVWGAIHDSEAVDESEDEPNVDDNDWEVVDDESEDEPTSVTWDIIEWQ